MSVMVKRREHVAAAAIISADEAQVLLARRPSNVDQGGLWEFPGGKVESSETVQQAVARELKEELDIHLTASEPLLSVRHDYGDRRVHLDVWWSTEFDGEPRGMQHQAWCWATVAELDSYAFPAANKPIIAAVKRRLAAAALT